MRFPIARDAGESRLESKGAGWHATPFGALRPGEFEKCLLSWITALHEISDGQIVAIDGKTFAAARAPKRSVGRS